MFKAEDQASNEVNEYQEIVTTVPEKLEYIGKALTAMYDLHLQKESTNQIAKADLVVDGETIAEQLPATFLLGMENELKQLRSVLDTVPTLPPGTEWQKDDQRKSCYKTARPEENFKTAKTFRHIVLAEAIVKDGVGIPAQIEKWTDTENVGKYQINRWCGMLTSAQKSEILERCDKLIVATKKARQRANDIDASKDQVGDKLLAYIFKPIR